MRLFFSVTSQKKKWLGMELSWHDACLVCMKLWVHAQHHIKLDTVVLPVISALRRYRWNNQKFKDILG